MNSNRFYHRRFHNYFTLLLFLFIAITIPICYVGKNSENNIYDTEYRHIHAELISA